MATQTSSKTHNGRKLKEKRITVRVTDSLKERVEEAANLSGRTLTDFIVQAIQEQADEVIQKHHVLELSLRDMDALVDALENPPNPNSPMRRSVARWRAYGAPE